MRPLFQVRHLLDLGTKIKNAIDQDKELIGMQFNTVTTSLKRCLRQIGFRHGFRFRFVFFSDFSLKFQISIGQGWGGTARTDGTARTGPSPGQLKFEIWNLKFEIWIFEIHRILSCENGRPKIIRRPSTEHPSTARREKNQRKTKCVSNDRSRHDDSFCVKIVKIGAILKG